MQFVSQVAQKTRRLVSSFMYVSVVSVAGSTGAEEFKPNTQAALYAMPFD
jgi:hypothetical protein